MAFLDEICPNEPFGHLLFTILRQHLKVRDQNALREKVRDAKIPRRYDELRFIGDKLVAHLSFSLLDPKKLN